MALFDLLWASKTQAAETAARIGNDSWARIDATARQHRLRPLLCDRLIRAAAMPHVPDATARQWRRSQRGAALRALRQRIVLIRVGRLLQTAGIEAVALKGAAIVWRGWIDPALRPMRDLDILVAEGEALRAHALLRDHGFTGPPAVATWPDKHLPGLTDPETRVHVEIHTRLAASRGAEWDDGEARFRDRATVRATPAAESAEGMARFDPTDTLLHVILHGVIDHQFNNGPLMLFDISLLVAHGGIDWPRFWADAQALGIVRACVLSLRIAERYACLEGVGWTDRHIAIAPDQVVDAAAGLMLIDVGQRSELGWAGRLAGGIAGGGDRLWAMIRRRWRATRPAATASGDRLVPLRRAMVMIATAGHYAGSLARPGARRHVRHSLEVANWLRGA